MQVTFKGNKWERERERERITEREAEKEREYIQLCENMCQNVNNIKLEGGRYVWYNMNLKYAHTFFPRNPTSGK